MRNTEAYVLTDDEDVETATEASHMDRPRRTVSTLHTPVQQRIEELQSMAAVIFGFGTTNAHVRYCTCDEQAPP